MDELEKSEILNQRRPGLVEGPRYVVTHDPKTSRHERRRAEAARRREDRRRRKEEGRDQAR